MLDEIDSSFRKAGYSGTPVMMYLAGGLAVNYYCGTRYTEDVDAFFDRRIQLGRCAVAYRHRDGSSASLYLDPNYNPTFGLLHDDYEAAAREWPGIGNEGRLVRLMVLSPLDLAVTKISRYADTDVADIRSLASVTRFSADQLRRRATEALSNYVGNLPPVRQSIELICKEVARVAERDRALEQAAEKGFAPPKTKEGPGPEIS
ncbi:MAG TPA: DUF6036 family nucleotidyltransferase [Opitutaceae bacterium]